MIKKLIAAGLTVLLLSANVMAAVPNKVLKAHESSVFIHIKLKAEIDGQTRTGWGSCSGAYVQKNVILSASHCTNPREGIKIVEIWIQQPNGKSAKAEILTFNTAKDLLLLKTSLEGKPLNLADSRALGDDVYATGSPLGIRFVLTHGLISKLNFIFDPQNPVKHFVTDAMVLPGSSGCSMLNSKGEIVGVLVRSTSLFGAFGGVGLGVAVELEEVREFLKVL